MILETILRSGGANPNDPNQSLYDPDVIDALIGDDVSTASGVRVNSTNAQRVSAVFACIRVISETCASLPWITYEQLEVGKQRARSHPVYDLLQSEPNPRMSPFTFKELIFQHMEGWGNAYINLQFAGSGRVVGLWPLLPDRTTPVLRKRGKTTERWLVTEVNGQLIKIPPGKYIHIPGPGFDGLVGYNPILLAREAIGLSIATEKFSSSFFGRGALPGAVLKSENKLKPDQIKRLHKEWSRMHEGLKNSHRTAILDGGMDIEAIGLPNTVSQLLETRIFQIVDICRRYRVPPHKVQELSNATYSNIESLELSFAKDSITPRVARVEQATNMVVFLDREKEKFFTEFLLDGLLRGDAKTRAEALSIQRQNGIINADEWRALENLNPQPDGQGKIYLIPLNMVDAAQVVDAGEVLGDGSDDDSGESSEDRRVAGTVRLRRRHRTANRILAQRTFARIVRREASSLRRASRAVFSSDTPKLDLVAAVTKSREYLDTPFDTEVGPLVRSLVESVAGMVELETGITVAPDERCYRGLFVALRERYFAATSDGLSEIDSRDGLIAILDQWLESRAGETSSTETLRLEGAVARHLYNLSGLSCRWVAAGCECDHCERNDGRRVNAGQNFEEHLSHPPGSKDCTAVLVATTKEKN